MSVQQNIANLNVAVQKMVEHPMHVRHEFRHDVLLAIMPDGYQVDAVRVSLANGKLRAVEKAVAKMEQFWRESDPRWQESK